jgi:hypothetical protein
MINEMRSVDEAFVPTLRFLVCDITDNIDGRISSHTEWVSSPIQCLNQAVDRNPGVILIRFDRMPIRARETLVELIAALKQNRYTQKCSVVALLHSKHRQLIEDLKRVDVDYIRYIGDAGLEPTQVEGIIEKLGEEDQLERHLETLCPFLHYSRIDSENEMTVCGAYMDRLVLGGRRLHEVCETGNHLSCDYYRLSENSFRKAEGRG